MNLPDPGIKLGSPELQEDSLPTELLGNPRRCMPVLYKREIDKAVWEFRGGTIIL